jgi:acetyltransferase
LCFSIRWYPLAVHARNRDRETGDYSSGREKRTRNQLRSVTNEAKQVSRTGLDAMFQPDSVAVIGATERAGTVGRTVLENLRHPSFQGKLYAVNSRHSEVCGLKAYRSISEVPERIDLAVVATPATSVPGIIGECVNAGAKSAVVISAGFRESGAEGVELERQIQEQLHRGTMRLIGPNCLGIMNPTVGLNATFAKDAPRPGNVAFLSQSGALLTAILDWGQLEHVGFSAIVSTGSMLDVGWGDLIYHFGDDPNTQSILLYMESVGDARSFLSAAREVALRKPVIVIKAGRSEAASRAAASHTGALTGSDEVLDAAFRRSGVLRVNAIADLFYMAEVLSKQPRPKGPRLTILTNAGGPAVLATDALVANSGQLAVPPKRPCRRWTDFCRGTGATTIRLTSLATRTQSVMPKLLKSPPLTRIATASWSSWPRKA